MKSRESFPRGWTNLAVVGIGLFLSACQPGSEGSLEPGEGGEKPRVFAVNYPLAWLAERLGGEEIEVVFPVPGNVDPAWWEPEIEEIQAIQAADLILLNGADYARWTLRNSLPELRVVITTAALSDRLIEVPDAITHSHGGEGEHSHAVLAAETWTDPLLAIEQARAIRLALESRLKLPPARLEENLSRLSEELRQLDDSFAKAFAATPVRWTASRPGFSYLGRRYGLDLEFANNWSADEVPGEKDWERFAGKLAGAATETVMLWDAEPLPAVRDRLREMGIEVLVFETGANRPESGDYLALMRRNLERLREGGDRPR